MSNCVKCHSYGEQLKNSNCLTCHIEIKKLIFQDRGYHSSSSVKNKNCWDCHGEHFGRDFKIIKFDRDKFNHTSAGFKLTGKHSTIKCEDCHNKKFISGEIKKKGKTFLGLDQNCTSCHKDIHFSTLGNDCNECHNTLSFKPAALFDHNNSKFRLTGKHIDIECSKCHHSEIRNGNPFTKYTGLQFSNCFPCHKDVHSGRLGSDCKQCHVVAGFQFINKQNFNHDKTNYPLTGAHKTVACRNCHKGSISEKPKFESCQNCHADFHKGEFVSNTVVRDCKGCHITNSFTPSIYSIDQHNELEFKLTDAHLAVQCKNCHFINDKWSFRLNDKSCTGCHSNIHGNEILVNTKKIYGCTDCHSIKSWNDLYFNHLATGFELSGKHKETKCRACHYREENDKKEYLFASTDQKCITCHKDIHLGQFVNKGDTGCSDCHSFDNWQPERFNHNLTKFPLEGGHKNINCNKCHTVSDRNGIKYVQYKLADFKCSACHS